MKGELIGVALYLTALAMLTGVEGEEWAYYETDPTWWAVRLYTRIN